MKEDSLPDPKVLREVEKQVGLRVVDMLWMEHIDQMSHLRDSVSLRGYAQRDPLMEYKQEAYQLFSKLLATIQHNIINTLFKLQIKTDTPIQERTQAPAEIRTNQEVIEGNITTSRMQQGNSAAAGSPSQNAVLQRISADATRLQTAKYAEVGRNDECPCGSGKKFKKCHGAGA